MEAKKIALEVHYDDSNASTEISENSSETTPVIGDDKLDAEQCGANICQGKTGGVEFVYPKPFINYSEILYSSNVNYIAFECSSDSEKEIISTINKLLIPDVKVTNLSEIWETILDELSNGFLINNQLPFISLHFNKNCLIYSVMHNYYKRTLVGHILCFLDFFLKGFMNGGFFTEEFAYSWYINGRNEDNDYLCKNFINLKEYLYKNNLSNLDYNSMQEIGDDILFKKKQAFMSSSRIIGKMEDILKVCDNIIFPNCNYNVEGDFDIFPEYLAELMQKQLELMHFIIDAQKTRLLMKIKCLLIMEKIPYFKSYFLLLKIITFALHYLPTLKTNSLYPELKNSLANKGKPYVKNLPTIFPPIPIYKRMKIKPNRTLKDFLDMLDPAIKEELTNEIKKQKNSSYLNYSSLLKSKIKEQIKVKYREYLLSITDKKDDIKRKTDYELKINTIIDRIFYLLNKLLEIPNIRLTQLYNQFVENEKIKNKFSESVDKYPTIQDKANILNEIFKYFKEINEQDEINSSKAIEDFENIQKKNKDVVEKQNLEKQEILKNLKEFEENHKKTIEELNNIDSIKESNHLEIEKNANDFLKEYKKKRNKEAEEQKKIVEKKKNENFDFLKKEMESNKNKPNIDKNKLEEMFKKHENEININYNKNIEKINKAKRELIEAKEKEIKEKVEYMKKENDKKIEEQAKKKEEIENENYQKGLEFYNNILTKKEELITNNEKIISNMNEEILNLKIKKEENKKSRQAMYDLNKEIFDFIVEKYEKEEYLDFSNYFINNLCEDVLFLETSFKDRQDSSVRGGCLVKLNKKIVCIQKKDFVSGQLIKSIKNNNNSFHYNSLLNNIESNYLILKTNLKNGFYKKTEINDLNQEIFNSVKAKQECILKDNFGLSSGHYKMLCHKNKIYETIQKQELDQKTFYGERPEIYAVLSNNKKAVKYLLSKGDKHFNSTTDNGMNPLLYSMFNKSNDISKMIINNSKADDLNYSTETKLTPLYYSVQNNSLEISKLLVEKGALISTKNNIDGNTPFHLACDKGYMDLIDLFSHNCKELVSRPDKQSVLHRAVKNSLLSTKLLINNYNSLKDSQDILGYSPKDYALLNGRLDCYYFLNKDNRFQTEKKNNIFYNMIIGNNNQNINKNLYQNNLIDSLCESMKKNDTKNANLIASKICDNSELLKELNNSPKLKKKLVKSAIIGKNTIFLNILSHLIEVKEYPIAALIGKYGLITWIPELIEYGINIFAENKDKNIFDYSIETNNSDVIDCVLNTISEISDSHLSSLVCKILLNGNTDLINIALNKLNNRKFNNNKISFEQLGKSINSNELTFNFAKSFSSDSLKTIQITDAIKYCQNSFVNSLLTNKDLLEQEINPIELFEIAESSNRKDNLAVLCKHFPSILCQKPKFKDEIININKKIDEMESLLSKPSTQITNEEIENINKIIQSNEYRYFLTLNTKKFLGHLIIDNHMDILPKLKYSENFNIFIKDVNNNLPFFQQKFDEDNIMNILLFLSQNSVENMVSLFISIINQSFNFIREMGYLGFLTNSLLKILINHPSFTPETFIIKNKEKKTLFHLLAESNEIIEIDKIKLEELYEKIKIKYSEEKIKKFINQQDIYGNTILMYLLTYKHLFFAKKILSDFIDLYDFSLYNISGNTILHCLFENFNQEIKEENIENLLEICSIITEKCPSLILNNNFRYLTPWLLAARAGIQGALIIMVKYYPIEIIEEKSIFSSAIHEAAYYGKISMIKLLIEYFHYNANLECPSRLQNGYKYILFPEKSTPLYAAALRNSIESYEVLLALGANPFNKNIYGIDSISAFIKNADEKGLKYITNTISFKSNPASDLYLFDLIHNNLSLRFIKNYFKHNGFDCINIINDFSKNLLIKACEENKSEIVYYLLENNINLLYKDKKGNNALHYCSKRKSFSCNYILLEYLFRNNENGKIKNIINLKNKNGNTFLHIAAKKNCIEIIINTLVFISTYKIDIELERNNIGLTPLHLAINYKNWEIAFLLKNYFKISDGFIKNVGDEYKENINEYLKKENKGLNPKFTKKLESYSQINNFIKVKKNEDKMIKNYNYFNEKIGLSSEEIYIKYSKYINNSKFLKLLYKLKKNNFIFTINEFFNILQNSRIEEHEGIRALIEFFIGYIFPNNNYLNFIPILNSLEKIINSLISLTQNHNLFLWIQSIIISYYESGNFSKTSLDIIFTIEKFINIMNNSTYLSLLPKPIFPYSCYKFAQHLSLILSNKPQELGIIQLKYIDMIPPLLTSEIKEYSDYNIINYMSFSINPLYEFASQVFKDKKYPPNFIDYVIQGTLLIEKSIYIGFDEKMKIMKLIKKKYSDNIDVPEKILTTISILENLIINFGKEIFNDCIITNLDNNNLNIKDFEKVLLCLSQYKEESNLRSGLSLLNDVKSFYEYSESIKPKESGRSLEELIESFKKFDFKLTNEELNQLIEFGNNIKQKGIYSLNDLEIEGKKIGKLFRENPTVENLSKLLDVIRFGTKEILKMEPYLIQLLSVASFFLFFINKPKNLKGRLGQISTGEGKSLIVAILGLGLALQGRFVDIITSTGYLAKRDEMKFRPLFKAFGITSSNITSRNPSKEDYNGIILYGTNTDFEFSLLREELYMLEKMYTVPLDINILQKRKFDSVIVDESDNLFLDTALNSARLAYKADQSFEWVYKPIYEIVNKSKEKITIDEVKEYFKSYCNGLCYEKIKYIPDKKIENWISSCKLALTKVKGKDYIVKYDEESQKKKVFIVDLDTGRINIGSRWSYGVHEFVEIKENLIPEKESLTIASISHPSYYDNYNCIFGLTGTIGEINERKEIKEIYHLDSFDVPTNFESKKKIFDKIIVDSKEKKYEKIISEIKKNENRSILVILNTINETMEFSEKLKKVGIYNLLLNDVQNEKEEYILYYAGKPKSVVIATNAAGRGTDIILTKESLQNGGLFVIIGFFPENSRIEFQAIGRAGRQGQPGSAQIIFSKDEFKGVIINDVDQALKYRNKKIQLISSYRIERTKKERFYYENLQKYFNLQNKLYNILKKPKNSLILDKLREDWAKFFTNNSDEPFNNFLTTYSWEFLLKSNQQEIENILKEKNKIGM